MTLIGVMAVVFPRVSLATYGGRAFAYAGPTSWNFLPDSLKDINLSLTLQTFKRHLKTFLFSERELTFTFAICYRPSVCLSVCLSSVCLSVCL